MVKAEEYPKDVDLESRSYVDDVVTDLCAMVDSEKFSIIDRIIHSPIGEAGPA